MPIQIITDDERFEYNASGSTIFYRRIPAAKRGAIIKRYTKKGKTDWNPVTRDILDYVIIGWKDVQCKGKDIPYSIDKAMQLPDENLKDILDLSGGSDSEGEETPEKNLKTT